MVIHRQHDGLKISSEKTKEQIATSQNILLDVITKNNLKIEKMIEIHI